MSDNILKQLRIVVQKWANQQGHDRCHYYPELFRELAKILEIKTTVDLILPPEEEFEKGCVHYRKELYHNNQI